MKGSRFRFFATGEEMKKCFLDVEKTRKIKYIKDERYLTKDIIVYDSIVDIPNLGINTTGSQNGDYYIILDKKEEVVLKEVDEASGVKTYDIHEGLNLNSISFRHNGLYMKNYLIWNLVETMKGKDSPVSYSLYQDIVKSLKRVMRRAASDCYISQGAEELYKKANSKIRLIGMGYDQPEEYDVKL
jgi:hypothetical protein